MLYPIPGTLPGMVGLWAAGGEGTRRRLAQAADLEEKAERLQQELLASGSAVRPQP